ncbi:glycosyltransferase family 25 protein [Aeromonas salmonicida]|uniref:glycosyltransferase family 25 protein n=1 Tax=Aeromonas salmonicida TaxID=645 RepID=UPI001C5D44C7|nr:glycosyltransferase family 25 protein [Aeromonas salmonicida]MCE9935580.1 glycosyltransferase family 25 protein [Aeromonas salmonicida]
MKIYVISLEKATERRHRVESVLSARGIEFNFFNAVNGFDGLPERLRGLPDDQHRVIFRSRPLTPGEKGCYASHFLLWEKCVELNEPILILEDDFLPTQYFEEVLKILPKVHEEYEYVKVEPQVGLAKALTTVDNMQLMFWHNNMCWTTGYSISPQGARRLLGHSKRWLCSVDNFIGESYRTGLVCVGLIPYAIYSPRDMGSDIQNQVTLKKVPLGLKLTREIYRFYRFIRMSWWNSNNARIKR